MSSKAIFSNSSLESINGVDYLQLNEEDYYKTGFVAGTLFVSSNYKVIKLLKNPFVKIILEFLYWKHRSRLLSIRLPEGCLQELKGYSDSTKIPYKYLHLINLIYEIRGCSSFATFNSDAFLLVGHNTDVSKSLAKFILRYVKPLITKVSIPGNNNFVHVSFPLFIGVTNGFNNQGIAITSHDVGNVFNKIVENNISTSCFSRMILEKAGSLNDVYNIAKNNLTYLPVNTLVVSREEGKFSILEMYPSDFNFTSFTDRSYLNITNHYQSEKMQKYHQGIETGSVDRLECLDQLSPRGKDLSIQDAISILKDHRNGLKRDSSGHSVANEGTFQSFVFDVTKEKIYISNGKRLPVSLWGDFVEIRISLE